MEAQDGDEELVVGLLETDGTIGEKGVVFTQNIRIGEGKLCRTLLPLSREAGIGRAVPAGALKMTMPRLYEGILQRRRSNLVDGLSAVLDRLGIGRGGAYLAMLRLTEKGHVSAVWAINIFKKDLSKLPFTLPKWRRPILAGRRALVRS